MVAAIEVQTPDVGEVPQKNDCSPSDQASWPCAQGCFHSFVPPARHAPEHDHAKAFTKERTDAVA